MPIRTALWKVTAQPTRRPEAILSSEKMLEDMIVTQPLFLSDAWMLIDRQEHLYWLLSSSLGTMPFLQISRPKIPAVPRRMKSCTCQHDSGWMSDFTPHPTLAGAMNDFLSGASIADACLINREDPRQLEALLRLSASPVTQ